MRKLTEVMEKKLKDKESTRKDDFVLLYEIYKEYGIELPTAFKEGRLNKLPSPESITRARRKVQELHPELVDEKTKFNRAIKEMAMRINIIKEEM